MIAYQDLVVALKSWRARNGLPDTPPDYGDAGQTYSTPAQGSSPDEIYDLSDDSGLIVAEDLGAAQAAGEYEEDYAAEPVASEAYDDGLGAIETGVEVSAESAMPAPDDYDNPPGTDAYTDYSPAELDPYGAQAQTDDYAEPPAEQYGEQAYAEQPAESYDDQAYAEQPAESYDDQAYAESYDDQAYAEPAPLAEPEYDDAPQPEAAADDYGATVVGGDEYDAPASVEGTLESDPADVVEEVDLDAAADAEIETVDAADVAEELPPMETLDDEANEEATVVASEHGLLDEPEALPDVPPEPDRE